MGLIVKKNSDECKEFNDVQEEANGGSIRYHQRLGKYVSIGSDGLIRKLDVCPYCKKKV